MRSRIFPIFVEFSFFNTFVKVCIKKITILKSKVTNDHCGSKVETYWKEAKKLGYYILSLSN